MTTPLTNRWQAINAMRQCEALEKYMRQLKPGNTLDTVDRQYNDLLDQLVNFFETPEQQAQLDAFPGDAEETTAFALRLGIDTEFAHWLYSLE